MYFQQLISSQSRCQPFYKVFHYVAEKSLSVSLTRMDLLLGGFDLCSMTSTFHRHRAVGLDLCRVYADRRTYSRTRDFRWNRKGPSWVCAAGRETSRLSAALRLDWQPDSRHSGSETDPARSSATISSDERRTSNAGLLGMCHRCHQSLSL